LADKKVEKRRAKRRLRVRSRVKGTETRPRLSVFRSAKHIYVQAIADDKSCTLASASTLSKELREVVKGMKKTEAAREVGRLISRRLKELGIGEAVFDRGCYLYHGRVKAVADGAREEGLKF